MIIGLTNNELVKQILTNSLQIFKLIVRLLRKRIVLALIFTLSFTYCLLSLIRDRNHVKSMSGNLYDYETNVDIDRLNIIPHLPPLDQLDNDSKSDLGLGLRLSHVQLNHKHNNRKNDINLIDQMDDHDLHGSALKCRNSIQGKVLIADDTGRVCPRKDVLLSGCCDANSANTKLYSCDTCQSHGCCAIYEFCISCCLEPNKKPLLTKIVGAKTSETFSVLMASITDHFELCLTKCRTSSASVQHENSYRDPKAKHCYGESTEKVN